MKHSNNIETHVNFMRHYKRLFNAKLSEVSVKNISSKLEHKPNYELILTKHSIILRIKPGHLWEEWIYETQKNRLTLNQSLCTQDQANVFLDMFDYIIDENNKSHVFVLEQ